jgi:hypothetical protein
VPDREDGRRCGVERQSLAEYAARGQELGRLAVVPEALRGAPALQCGRVGIDDGGFAQDAEDGRGAREGVLPELHELVDDAARVGLRLCHSTHELRHGLRGAVARGGEVEHAREELSLAPDRVVNGLDRPPAATAICTIEAC